MAKLSKSNKYAIYWLNHQGETEENIAKELNLSLTQVSRCVKVLSVQATQEEHPPAKNSSKDFMINKTAGKGEGHVSIMTKAASEMNDEVKKKSSDSNPNLDRPGIFRPIQ